MTHHSTLLGEIGKNRGVVCFEREEEMQRACDELDGREINGRAVKLTDKVCTSDTGSDSDQKQQKDET